MLDTLLLKQEQLWIQFSHQKEQKFRRRSSSVHILHQRAAPREENSDWPSLLGCAECWTFEVSTVRGLNQIFSPVCVCVRVCSQCRAPQLQDLTAVSRCASLAAALKCIFCWFAAAERNRVGSFFWKAPWLSKTTTKQQINLSVASLEILSRSCSLPLSASGSKLLIISTCAADVESREAQSGIISEANKLENFANGYETTGRRCCISDSSEQFPPSLPLLPRTKMKSQR